MAAQRFGGDGLGPMYNAKSCIACHVDGGASGVDRNVTMITIDPRSPFIREILQRGSVNKKNLQEIRDVFPGLVGRSNRISIETAVHDHSIRPTYVWIRDKLKKLVAGGASDAWFDRTKRTSQAAGERPVLSGRHGKVDFYLSQRNSPLLFGLRLIDRIPQASLEKIAQANLRKSGGTISGRVGLGKFGWRAQTATLDQFVRGACAGELGLQVSGNPQAPDVVDDSYSIQGFDMTFDEVTAPSEFVSYLPVPERDKDTIVTKVGNRIFKKIGCANCHVENVAPAYGVYSDLLLHDMGKELAAPSPAPIATRITRVPVFRIPGFSPKSQLAEVTTPAYYGVNTESGLPMAYPFPRPLRPRFPYGDIPETKFKTTNLTSMTWDHFSREWRTPPLWGVADSGPYLHDGRAKSIHDAILWHGSEAKNSVEAFRQLSIEDRYKVLAFLRSLKAPVISRKATDKENDTTTRLVSAPANEKAKDANGPPSIEAIFAQLDQ